MRRGLTLIEVLASAALLAAVAAAVIPWITDARRLAQDRAPAITPETLADIADAVLDDPEAFGLPPLPAIGETTQSVACDTPDVTVRRFLSENNAFAWLLFEAGGISTARPIRLPRESPP